MEKPRRLVILILGLLSTVGPFSIDMYLPGFPAIALGLGTSVAVVQYSLSSYFIGICIGQLICGPLLDRFGRKLPLYAGLCLYIAASLGCAMATTVEMLIGMRFLQALGGCVGLVAPRAIVRDVFPVKDAPKIFATLMLVISVSPILAPTAGSYVIHFWGWQAVFLALALIAVLVLAATAVWLPESRPPDKTLSIRIGPTLTNYGQVLKDRQFLTYCLVASIASAGLYAYIAGSPAVFMQLFGVSEKVYGWIFASMAVGLIGCAQINGQLLRWYSSRQIMQVAVAAQASVGMALAVGTATGAIGLYGTTGLIFFYLSAQGFIGPNGSALAMAPFSRNAGTASAMLGAIQMGLGASASAVAGLLSDGTALPMTGVMAACSASALLIWILGKRSQERRESLAEAEAQAFEMIEKY